VETLWLVQLTALFSVGVSFWIDRLFRMVQGHCGPICWFLAVVCCRLLT
jgi:hypothetical protein